MGNLKNYPCQDLGQGWIKNVLLDNQPIIAAVNSEIYLIDIFKIGLFSGNNRVPDTRCVQ